MRINSSWSRSLFLCISLAKLNLEYSRCLLDICWIISFNICWMNEDINSNTDPWQQYYQNLFKCSYNKALSNWNDFYISLFWVYHKVFSLPLALKIIDKIQYLWPTSLISDWLQKADLKNSSSRPAKKSKAREIIFFN